METPFISILCRAFAFSAILILSGCMGHPSTELQDINGTIYSGDGELHDRALSTRDLAVEHILLAAKYFKSGTERQKASICSPTGSRASVRTQQLLQQSSDDGSQAMVKKLFVDYAQDWAKALRNRTFMITVKPIEAENGLSTAGISRDQSDLKIYVYQDDVDSEVAVSHEGLHAMLDGRFIDDDATLGGFKIGRLFRQAGACVDNIGSLIGQEGEYNGLFYGTGMVDVPVQMQGDQNTSYHRDLVEDDKGRILTVGTHNLRGYVARYLPDGAPDTAFGDSAGGGKRTGKFTFNYQNLRTEANGVSVQKLASGRTRVVFAGRVFAQFERSVVGMLNEDGILETQWGAQGLSWIGENEFVPLMQGHSHALKVVASADAVYVGGMTYVWGYWGPYVAKLNAQGSIDTTYSTDQAIPGVNLMNTPVAQMGNMILNSDGSLVVQVNLNGDPSTVVPTLFFMSPIGKVLSMMPVFVGSGSNPVYEMKRAPDGDILLLSRSLRPYVVSSVSRVRPNGSLLTSFGINGTQAVRFGNGDSSPRGLSIQKDGKIIVSGVHTQNSSVSLAVARLLADGQTDTSFGRAGVHYISGLLFPVFDRHGVVMTREDGTAVFCGSVAISGPGSIFAPFLFALNLWK